MSISSLTRNLRGAALRGSFLVTLGKGLGQEELSYLGVVTLDRGLVHFSWSGRDLAERGYFLRVGERERALVAYVFLLLLRLIRMMIRNKRI